MKKDAEKRIDLFREFMSQLTNLTGKSISTASDMKRIYDTLMCERNMNLTLPDWSNEIFPDGKLFEGALLKFDLQAYDTKMLRFINGKVLSIRKVLF